jgi:hypothetical protein
MHGPDGMTGFVLRASKLHALNKPAGIRDAKNDYLSNYDF